MADGRWQMADGRWQMAHAKRLPGLHWPLATLPCFHSPLFNQVPISQLWRYFCCSVVNLSREMPMVWSLSEATNSSTALGAWWTLCSSLLVCLTDHSVASA